MKELYKQIIQTVDNPDRPGLIKTPERAAEAFQFLTSGYNQDLQSLVNNAVYESASGLIIEVKDIEFYSLCEHHLLPFFGTVNVTYMSNGKIIGLSKVARIVDMFSRRLQVQEKLTKEIGEALVSIIGWNVKVELEAQHLCMLMRGVCKQGGKMRTRWGSGIYEK